MKHWRSWYGTSAWKRKRALQLSMQPMCAMCLANGERRLASVADHVIPHRGDSKLFWFGQLQSLCYAHHDRSKQEIETKGYSTEIGVDGLPVDPNHPVYHRKLLTHSRSKSTNSPGGTSKKVRIDIKLPGD